MTIKELSAISPVGSSLQSLGDEVIEQEDDHGFTPFYMAPVEKSARTQNLMRWEDASKNADFIIRGGAGASKRKPIDR